MDYTSFAPGASSKPNMPLMDPPAGGSSPQNNHLPKFVSIIALIILVGGVASGSFWYWQNMQIPDEPIPTFTPRAEETADWKVFSSSTEGFTLKYPKDWTIENTSNGNCGHSNLNGSTCRDRYNFVSADGIRVRYVIFSDENNDRISCGVQSFCLGDNVLGLEKLDIQNLGQVYLVKLDKQVSLHKPLSTETTPVLGENKHDNFDIWFSLPSKIGGRYSLFITTSSAGSEPPQLKNLTTQQFYNLKSVQDGIQILKSLQFTDSSALFCGGIAGIQCPSGYSCKLDGTYPDAGGKCVKNAVACTQEAKQCPDGSYVGRTGPNCEFTVCPGTGTLTGHVTIGPNCPVEQAGNPCTPSPQAYTSRQVFVYKADGITLVATHNFDTQGNYSFSLPSGTYVVKSKTGISSINMTVGTVTVKSGQTSTLNFSIDTGIR